ncbi:MAG TPA: protein kinase [Bryobacteraceae bacterium]
MTLAPGARLGVYEILGRLGAGAMGEVYRARDTRLGRDVAIKILPPEFAESPERRRRFEQEARAASALNHPNIVSIYDAGTEGGTAYIVSELVDGESLRDVIGRGAIPVRRAVELAAQIADGLASAHAAGVVHRDIKPENVMLTRDGRAKILDFGLARQMTVAAGEGTLTVTQPGAIMGTAAYMSPEQVSGTPADARSDIFSLGIMLYEMLTGKLPFERATPVETMSAILREEPAEFPIAAPVQLQQVVLHCLEKQPAARYQSAQDLAFNLRAYAAGHTSMIGQAAPAAAAKPRRWPWVAALGAAALLGAAAIALLMRPSGQDLSQYRFTPFAVESERQQDPAWSPDGKNLAYIRSAIVGKDEILVRSIDSLVPTLVAKVDNPGSLFWSPDGARIYFLNNSGVWSVSRVGGEPEQLLKGQFAAAALSPDGKALVLWLTVGKTEADEPKVWISSPPGAPIREYKPVLIHTMGSYTPVYLRFAPDGRQILLSRPADKGAELWLLPFPDGGTPRRLLEKSLAGADVPAVSWMPDGRHFVLAFASAAYPQSRLWLAEIGKDAVRSLTADEGRKVSPAVSPDGKRIAFGSESVNFDIVELPIGGSTPRPLIATSRDDTFPAWSANGRLAYVTNRNGAPEIWIRSQQDGSDRPAVTERDFSDDRTVSFRTLAVSPDGTRLAYCRESTKELGRIWISPVSGGTPIRLTNGSHYEIGPSWSPDGAWISYFAAGGGLMKARVGGSSPPAALGDISPQSPPQWSPDGQWIAWGERDAIKLISPDGKEKRSLGTHGGYVSWSRDSKELYQLRRAEEGRWRLSALDVKTGAEKMLSDYGPDAILLSPSNPSFPLSLSPDGKSLATTLLNYRSDIWLMEGFQVK